MEGECGVEIKFNSGALKGKTVPGIQGSGVAFDSLIDGGLIDNENPAFTIRRAAIEAVATGRMPDQGDLLTVYLRGVKTGCFKVKARSNDPADPSIRITTEGPEQ